MSHLSSSGLSDALAALKDAVNSVVDDNHTNHLLGRAVDLSQRHQRFQKRPESTRPVVDADEQDMDPISPDRSVQLADSVAEVAEVAEVVGVGFYQDEADEEDSSGSGLDDSFSTPGIIEKLKEFEVKFQSFETEKSKRVFGSPEPLVYSPMLAGLIQLLEQEMFSRDKLAKALIVVKTQHSQDLARGLYEQTQVNQGLTTELQSARENAAAQTERANGAEARNLQLQAKVVQLETRNDQLKATLSDFVRGVTGKLTSIQDDIEARLRKLDINYDPKSFEATMYRVQQLRNAGNTRLASDVEDLTLKYRALSSAKAAIEQNPSVQSLNNVFDTLLNSAAVRKSHTGFRAVFGLESATHKKIADQALAFRNSHLNGMGAAPVAQLDNA